MSRAATPRCDHQPLVTEPRVGEAHAGALLADQLRGGHPHVVERHHGVRVRIRVGVARLAHQAHARRVLVDDEQRVLALVIAADELGLEEDVVGAVVGRDVHLLAVEHVVAAVTARRRLDRVDVGARTRLGDRVALVALAADRRLQPGLDLLGRHHLRRPGGRGVQAPAQRIRDAADLLGDEHLLQRREPAAAKLLRQVHRGQAELAGLRLVGVLLLLGDLPTVLLGVQLPRDQVLVDETARPRLHLTVGGGEWVGRHGRTLP
jgi:hypothetical protein